jgi:prepilin-type N-terminal cleavage/methylation domain-containing protein
MRILARGGRPKQQSGFTLIESLIGSALLVIFFGAIAIIMHISGEIIGRERVRLGAQSLATERIELIRNMAYVDVGTIGGIPDGLLAATDDISAGIHTYQVATTVVYIDDAFDGVAPVDTLPNDYKRAKVAVIWGGNFASTTPLTMFTDVSPSGSETDIAGGTIVVYVYDANGDPVETAQVHIVASSLIPPVDLIIDSDVSGQVQLPGAVACTECYAVSVTKAGYTTDRTYSTAEVANPYKPHLSVLEGEVTQQSFAIDRTSTVTFKAVQSNYTPFMGVQMQVTGAKEIGRDIYDQPVNKYAQLVVTGFGGQTIKTGMEWDAYTVSIPTGSSVDFAGSWPFSPFALLPNSSQTITIVVLGTSTHNLLVVAKDNSNNPMASGTVELKNDLVSYIATESLHTGSVPDRSQRFFPGLPTTNTPYQLTLSSVGYATASTEATISGEVIEQFILSPS